MKYFSFIWLSEFVM